MIVKGFSRANRSPIRIGERFFGDLKLFSIWGFQQKIYDDKGRCETQFDDFVVKGVK